MRQPKKDMAPAMKRKMSDANANDAAALTSKTSPAGSGLSATFSEKL
jgi:hypothetical protein